MNIAQLILPRSKMPLPRVAYKKTSQLHLEFSEDRMGVCY